MSDQTLAAIALGSFGLLVLAITLASRREAAAMKRWPIAKGRVLAAHVKAHRDVAGGSSSSGGAHMTLYKPVVQYEYTVDGKRYRGERITQSPGLDRGVPEFAEQIVRRYAEGSDVDVRYNPKRPNEAVLEPRVPRSWTFAVGIGVALLAVAAYE